MQRSRNPPDMDLDEADAEVRHRWFVWTAAGLTVHPVTWAEPPRSLGLRVSRPTAHVDILLYGNGRAEVAVLRPDADAVVRTTVQLASVMAFGQLLDRVVELITWSGVPKDRDPGPAERAGDWVLGYDGGHWSDTS